MAQWKGYWIQGFLSLCFFLLSFSLYYLMSGGKAGKGIKRKNGVCRHEFFPTYFNKCSASPFAHLPEEAVEEKSYRIWRKQTCLTKALWGRAQSSSLAVQSCGKHQVSINSCSAIFSPADPTQEPAVAAQSSQQADTKPEPATVVLSWKNSEGHQPRGRRSLTRQFFGEFLSMVALPQVDLNNHVRQTNTHIPLVKNSKTEETKPKPNAHCLWGNCGVIFKLLLHRSCHVAAIAKHPFTCVFFRKTFFHMSALAKHSFFVCSSKPSFDITDIPKKLEGSTSGL